MNQQVHIGSGPIMFALGAAMTFLILLSAIFGGGDDEEVVLDYDYVILEQSLGQDNRGFLQFWLDEDAPMMWKWDGNYVLACKHPDTKILGRTIIHVDPRIEYGEPCPEEWTDLIIMLESGGAK